MFVSLINFLFKLYVLNDQIMHVMDQGNKLRSLVMSNDQMILQFCGNNDFSLLEGFIELKYIFG